MASAGEPGHHCADRHLNYLRDLVITEPLNFTQHHRLQKRTWKRRHRGLQADPVGLGNKRRFWSFEVAGDRWRRLYDVGVANRRDGR